MNYTDASRPSMLINDITHIPPTVNHDDILTSEEATERVAELVGDDVKCNELFCQMDVLRPYEDDLVWKEMARWVRYEEAVEEGGERWSKPHVASLMMEALQDLQTLISTCPVILDTKATKMPEIAGEVVDAWMRDQMFPVRLRAHFEGILLKQHIFQFITKKDHKNRNPSYINLQLLNEAYTNGGYHHNGDSNNLQVPPLSLPRTKANDESPSLAMYANKTNKSFMRKIPHGAEAVNLLVGDVEELDKVICAFVRLGDSSNVGDITEVPLDTKFLFILLAPSNHLGHCAEMGRCMATLFTDEIFRCVAYRAEGRGDVLAGIQEFSLHLTVLPPGVWDPTTRIEPPDELPCQDYRTNTSNNMPKTKSAVSLTTMAKSDDGQDHDQEESHCDPTLVRSGKLFGGLIADVKRKLPHYASDFKDAFHIQCVASFFFLFLATLTPNVTFGGLLGQATDQYMGTMECILSAAISGVLFALFSGQPLNILGSTGPMLVLEAILYRFCEDSDWDFMPFRVWVGLWTALMLFLIVMFDLSALVRYITRFTEESFACLIALIFIYEAFKKTFEITKIVPVQFNPTSTSPGCFCLLGGGNHSINISMDDVTSTTASTITGLSLINTTLNTTLSGNASDILNKTESPAHLNAFSHECLKLGGVAVGDLCDKGYVPDAFFTSILLFLGTYFLATALVEFRHSLFFPTWVRTNVSDFAVLITIVIMVVIDAMMGLPTPKLSVPTEFKPTRPGRPWFINPISEKNPWWLYLFSAVPAILATILIFMDQQITAVIVNRRENKLKKGSGYHLDLLVVAVLVVILSILGLPWYVAATVTALAHIMSLKKVSECTAPGEKPVFLGVREQRVTGLLVGLFSGLAVLITSVLSYVPMPVLYGVFLFMGVAPLGGMQLVQRIMLVFMPAKYQPEYSFIRNVPIRRVHMFTGIQVLCLAVLWVVKSIHSISIAFPLMVLIICFVRKAMDKLYTQRELKWLDDILPATQEKKDDDIGAEMVEPIVITVSDNGFISNGKRPSRRSVSAPQDAETAMDDGIRKRSVAPRFSLAFVCKTDLDLIKEMAPVIAQATTMPGNFPGALPGGLTVPGPLPGTRRQSLINTVERKRSLQMYDGSHIGRDRKISMNSTLERKMSHDSYGGGGSHPGSHPGSHYGSTNSIVEEHNKLNKMLSLPATIKDENENTDSD